MNELKSAWIFSVGAKDFNTRVLEQSKQTPVVVDFWAPWCAPCLTLGPILEKMIEQRAGSVLLAKVNTDEEERLAAEFGVQSLPTVVAFRNGQPVSDFIGLLSEREIALFLDRLGPTDSEKKTKQASELEKISPLQAEKAYRQILKTDGGQEAALLGLARVLIGLNQEGEASEILEQVGASGPNGAEAEKLKALIWLHRHAHDRGDEATLKACLETDPNNAMTLYDLGCLEAAAGRYTDGLTLLLHALERDKKQMAAKVREAMVNVFHVVGVRSVLADEYRDKLAALLY